VSGSPGDTERLPQGVEVISETRHERHTRLLARVEGPLLNPALTVESVGLEDLVLAYLESTQEHGERTTALPAGHR
jgi:ABC-2 type transport system ATP-binding protein